MGKILTLLFLALALGIPLRADAVLFSAPVGQGAQLPGSPYLVIIPTIIP